jgi:transporter family protein
MISGLLFAFGAALSSGIEKILRRSVLIKEDSLCYTFLFGLFAAIILLPLFFFKFQQPSNNYAWFLVILSGILWTIYSLLLFKAYSYLEASVAAPISRLKLFFVLILSVIFLGESLTFDKIFGTIFIFAGVAVIGYTKKKKIDYTNTKKRKGIFLIILSTVIISIVLLIDKYAMTFFNVETYTAPVYLISPILLTFFVIKRKKQIKSILKRNFVPTFITSLLSVGYYYMILSAFKYAEVSIVVPIVELSILVAVVGGILFLKEREDIPRKLIAAVILIIGAIILSGKLF